MRSEARACWSATVLAGAPPERAVAMMAVAVGCLLDWKSLAVGDRVYVKYHNQRLWHERLLLWPVSRAEFRWVVMTADGDIYAEDYGDDGVDVAAVRYSGAWAVVPAGVPPAREYRFRNQPTAQVWLALVGLRQPSVRRLAEPPVALHRKGHEVGAVAVLGPLAVLGQPRRRARAPSALLLGGGGSVVGVGIDDRGVEVRRRLAGQANGDV